MSLISVNNLSFSYDGSYNNIFENVSFNIDTDWKLGLIGRNGKGKTTFLKLLQGIYEYKGINLSPKSEDLGPHTCEIEICKDYRTGKTVKITEKKRFQSMLVVGVSGSGKTSLIFEPMIARDIDKKFQYRETSKELAFISLKTGLASLKCPYDNDCINNNFNLALCIFPLIKYMKKQKLRHYCTEVLIWQGW